MIPECARRRHLILASTLGVETKHFPMSVPLRPLQKPPVADKRAEGMLDIVDADLRRARIKRCRGAAFRIRNRDGTRNSATVGP